MGNIRPTYIKRKAREMFEAFLAKHKDHKWAGNAQYWIGECYDALGDYHQAVLAFEKVFTFNKSHKDDDAQYRRIG